MTDKEALTLALELLGSAHVATDLVWKRHDAVEATKEALAQPEQEHFALKHRIAELEGAVIGLQAQLAQPEQEPVAYASSVDWRKNHLMSKAQYDNCLPKNRVDFDVPLYTTPPQRLPLTDEEIILIVAECASSHQHTDIHFARAIERAHGIKGLV